ncbi:hypothetical protein BBK36DRAFT_1138990 [Trichoderma citrinoviride]|uniref:Uncharacterized protein n=1 Tax=Trichoderma citrinoviride TaxID=58853 RepID=A0A2T4BHV1_9HYPO|nr:hypothetical protein BBK36DRAFT_1138990 [Trichoderma citrinoviride]PTB68897.1 hypothetical protein BBK36DRAFT_1138990 [Trichoderma citrinoviride]
MFEQHQQQQPSQATGKNTPPSSSSDHPSSSAHLLLLLREQRLSTCLNLLRHAQRTLHQRHAEATAHLGRTSSLVAQSAWDLFSQSPLDFLCHEMDILTDDDDVYAVTNAILSDKSPVGIGSSSSSSSSDAWMEKLNQLRDLMDDEEESKQRVSRITRQREVANGMMRVGAAELGAVLARSDALLVRGENYRYRYRYQRGLRVHHAPTTMPAPVASSSPSSSSSRNVVNVDGSANESNSKVAAPVPKKSSFFDWPVPATTAAAASSKGKQAAVESEDGESSGTSSGLDSPRGCQGECCRH